MIRFATSLISTLGLLALVVLQVACNCEEVPYVESLVDEEPPPPATNRGFYVDMALDSQDRVWLAYQDRDATSLNLALGSGDPVEFTHWPADGQGEVSGGLLMGNFDGGFYATVAVDGADVPHAAHWDQEDGRLRYVTKSGDTITAETVDTGGVGEFASIGIYGGEPIIAYHTAAGSLKAASKSNGAWSTETVDLGDLTEEGEAAGATAADVGSYADLLVSANGTTVHIAYYDAANGNLKVASGSPGSWTVSTWAGDGDGNRGAWPNLSEVDGNLYVAFQDLDQHDLLFGRWLGSSLEFEVVDSGEFVGADAATAWTEAGAVLMYHDGVNNDAKLAVQGNGVWTISTHMEDGAVGFHNGLALGADGRLSWACLNHTTTDVHFQRFSL